MAANVMLSAICIMIASVAPAQTFQPNEVGGDHATYGITEHTGEVSGLNYGYSIDDSGEVVNGWVDGPAPTSSIASEDPDRWTVLPKRDKLTDKTDWYIIHYQTGLMLGVTAAGSIRSACVIGADFPARPAAVRVATSPAIRLPDGCSVAVPAALKAELTRGGDFSLNATSGHTILRLIPRAKPMGSIRL